MPELKTVRRVTIYADGALEATILDLCTKLGARGYTVLDCRSGKGLRESIETPFSGTPTRVRIELVVDPDVAHAIMTRLAAEPFVRRPVLAVAESIEVAPGVAY